MSRSAKRAGGGARKKSRRASLLWIAASALVIIVLIVQEQVALLYVLATLSVAALLTVVALSDLRGARDAPAEPAPFDDAAAIADGAAKAAPATSFGQTAPRRARTRQRR